MKRGKHETEVEAAMMVQWDSVGAMAKSGYQSISVFCPATETDFLKIKSDEVAQDGFTFADQRRMNKNMIRAGRHFGIDVNISKATAEEYFSWLDGRENNPQARADYAMEMKGR